MSGHLRPITEADLEDLLRWRNHPQVRRAMITQHRISREEHFSWWERYRKDKTRHWYISRKRQAASGGLFLDLDAGKKSCWWGIL